MFRPRRSNLFSPVIINKNEPVKIKKTTNDSIVAPKRSRKLKAVKKTILINSIGNKLPGEELLERLIKEGIWK